MRADPDIGQPLRVAKPRDFIELFLGIDDGEMSAESGAGRGGLGPAHVVLDDLIAVLGRDFLDFRQDADIHGDAGAGRGGVEVFKVDLLRRGRCGVGIFTRIGRRGLQHGIGDDPRFFKILEHGVHDDRHHHQNRAQHEDHRQRSSSAFFHLFCNLPFSVCLELVLHGGRGAVCVGGDRHRAQHAVVLQLRRGGRGGALHLPAEQIRLPVGDHVLLSGLGRRLLHGFIDLDAVLRLAGSQNLGGSDGCVLIFFDDAHHHALDVVEIVVVLFENGLGAGHAAGIEVFQAAVHHDAQFFERLITLGRLKADGLFNDRAEAAARALRCGGVAAAHALELLIALTVIGKPALVQGVIHEQTDGVDIGCGGELTVPILLGRDELQLLPLPGAFPGGADGDGAAVVYTDVVGVDAAPAAAGADFGDHGAAQIRDERAQLLLVHLREFFTQSLFRFK